MAEGKLGDIRGTASNTAEILRQLGSPGVQESLDKAKEITSTVKEIMEKLRTPEWVQNMENIRKIAEKMPDQSAMSGDGAFGDVKGLIQSTKNVMDSLSREEGGIKGRDLQELSVAFKELMQSSKVLMDELAAAAAESNRSGSLRNAKDASASLSRAYKTTTSG